MSEHVHVHAPHELTESETAPSVRSERIMELVATLLLAIATLGIAWSGYQGARWNGRQAEEYNAANGARLPREPRHDDRPTRIARRTS